ncbi:hypothetical protein [Rubellimicrobium sp. CFH 75288]|uniref:hypothetical protein n=1 Tax=Rubellimicrobium sp. CFH 75288 TaxID=2697034 RepID=UPI0014126651|nr:hypothetical protein [Rubellimicrobium sp. CFH 75288]NAZ36202.1 hypothetical protein [Rubellimicrobium sp. CFH 75288]
MTDLTLRAAGIAATFDPSLGLLASFSVTAGGRTVSPLHRAPWVDSGEALPPDLPPHLARLGGDFLCAPFAASEEGSPMHGWTANAPWTLLHQAPGLLRAALSRPVCGATVLKELVLLDGHPFVYQRHLFLGGEGRVPVANHANLALPRGAIIRTSPKAFWETPARPQEEDPARGRSALLYPARTGDPRAFPCADGGTADLLRYPWAPRHEDFVVAVEEPGRALGWTAVTILGTGTLFLSLRDPRALPMTMLWHSNGGRDYPPWSGRHVGCLGVEEGAAAAMLGLTSEGGLPGPGALRLHPAGTAETRHAIGAIPWPEGEPVADVALRGSSLSVTGEGGTSRTLPFREGFFGALS